MEVIVRASADAVADYVHDRIVEQLRGVPSSVLGLPTGGTPVPVYARLVESYRTGVISFKQATTFNLDEYIGLGSEHPASYAAYMRHHLFDHVDCPARRRHIPDGLASDVDAEAAAYDRAIANAGGMGLLLLGLGENAHIGFNEPGSDFASRTRPVDLAASTMAANARYFTDGTRPPTRALSMGIGTILEARSIIVMATGPRKAEAVRRMVREAPTNEVPGSALQLSRDVTVVLDHAASSKLERHLRPPCQQQQAPQ
ncbi:glucosamine-6-phosphate deaminase [Devosia sp. RR2S18]|uniref:glucosamine-6-phosphate deaminase n=1 Tax=Devosia rhizosphaerae TaxID=3049774 RepID=UPI00253FEA17|nr:glucosamine-6-phosphate deaminase [Devosia sp. RR2S18]WIJ27009.1 glucosamine-6-phosphate deaminase [Devosia sp. RR2S18]